MLNDLIDISFLETVLGYTDFRSIRNWCIKNKITILTLGKKKYIHRHEWEEKIGSLAEKLIAPINKDGKSKTKERLVTKVKVDDVFNSFKSK